MQETQTNDPQVASPVYLPLLGAPGGPTPDQPLPIPGPVQLCAAFVQVGMPSWYTRIDPLQPFCWDTRGPSDWRTTAPTPLPPTRLGHPWKWTPTTPGRVLRHLWCTQGTSLYQLSHPAGTHSARRSGRYGPLRARCAAMSLRPLGTSHTTCPNNIGRQCNATCRAVPPTSGLPPPWRSPKRSCRRTSRSDRPYPASAFDSPRRPACYQATESGKSDGEVGNSAAGVRNGEPCDLDHPGRRRGLCRGGYLAVTTQGSGLTCPVIRTACVRPERCRRPVAQPCLDEIYRSYPVFFLLKRLRESSRCGFARGLGP